MTLITYTITLIYVTFQVVLKEKNRNRSLSFETFIDFSHLLFLNWRKELKTKTKLKLSNLYNAHPQNISLKPLQTLFLWDKLITFSLDYITHNHVVHYTSIITIIITSLTKYLQNVTESSLPLQQCYFVQSNKAGHTCFRRRFVLCTVY